MPNLLQHTPTATNSMTLSLHENHTSVVVVVVDLLFISCFKLCSFMDMRQERPDVSKI